VCLDGFLAEFVEDFSKFVKDFSEFFEALASFLKCSKLIVSNTIVGLITRK
jgi:hypothetical protein